MQGLVTLAPKHLLKKGHGILSVMRNPASISSQYAHLWYVYIVSSLGFCAHNTPWKVYGPVLQEVTSMKKLNTSSASFYSIFNGEDKDPKNSGLWLWADVRNVAEAHLAALVSHFSKG